MFGHKLDLQRQEMTHLTEIIALLRFTPRTKPHIIIISISPPAHCPLILTQTGFTDIWIHWQILDIFKDNSFQLCLFIVRCMLSVKTDGEMVGILMT